jgi:hypothetical protein
MKVRPLRAEDYPVLAGAWDNQDDAATFDDDDLDERERRLVDQLTNLLGRAARDEEGPAEPISEASS